MKKERLRLSGGAIGIGECNPKLVAPHVPVNLRPPVFWMVAEGDIRIQVHCPEQARRLSRMDDVRLVAWSVAGGYLRIFAANRPPRWGRNLIAKLTVAYCSFGEPAARQSDDSGADRSEQREDRREAVGAEIGAQT